MLVATHRCRDIGAYRGIYQGTEKAVDPEVQVPDTQRSKSVGPNNSRISSNFSGWCGTMGCWFSLFKRTKSPSGVFVAATHTQAVAARVVETELPQSPRLGTYCRHRKPGGSEIFPQRVDAGRRGSRRGW